ncbi:MAG: hypothetical protein COB41_10615 [Proteobacteria bacterium]|nr:MAG: hypothetical protein COB41_10615 [Pseudomonadota bacterium]
MKYRHSMIFTLAIPEIFYRGSMMNARPPTQTLGGDGEMKNWSHEGVAVTQFLSDYINLWEHARV